MNAAESKSKPYCDAQLIAGDDEFLASLHSEQRGECYATGKDGKMELR